MPVANPIIGNSRSAYGSSGPTGTAPVGAQLPSGAGNSSRGAGPAGAVDRTPLHVGCVVLAALAVVVLLQLGGFRFVVDAGVGKGMK